MFSPAEQAWGGEKTVTSGKPQGCLIQQSTSMCISTYLNAAKPLRLCRGEPGLPKPGLGAELEPATLGNAARWMGCSVHNLHRSKKKSQDNQQLNSNCLWHLSLHPQPLLSEPGLGLTFPGLVPAVYFLCLCITEGPTWLSTV